MAHEYKTNHHYICTTFTGHENNSDTDFNAPSRTQSSYSNIILKKMCLQKAQTGEKMNQTMQNETNIFLCNEAKLKFRATV